MFSKKFENLLSCLPQRTASEIKMIGEKEFDLEQRIFEIRIRAGKISTINLDGKTQTLSSFVAQEELGDALKKLCRGSLYAYSESLREGYVSFFGGYRVGVAGRAVYEDGAVVGIGEPSSLCVRIPHNIKGAGNIIVDTFKKLDSSKGILVYARAGNGKTTMLRDAAITLSSKKEGYTVSLIDAREELSGDFITRECAIDTLLGYPKAKGIEIATRTLSPDVIICDEIGGYEEAAAILSVQSCGVPLIASAHGSCLEEIMSRGAIRILAKNRIFGAYIGIKRENNKYTYTVDYS